MYHFQPHLNALLFLFFPPLKQMSVYSRRFIFFCHVPASNKIIHLSDNMGSRQEVGGVDSVSNYPTSFLKGKKMLSVFKQLVHVAIASASLLHFPVSERQMNRNDCFVLLCSRLSELHKTYISSLPCATLYLQRGKRKGEIETLESGITVLKRRRSFLLLFFFFFFNCKAVLLSIVFLSRGHNWKRSFLWKGLFEKRLGNQIWNMLYRCVVKKK